jgi:hypothetical protein
MERNGGLLWWDECSEGVVKYEMRYVDVEIEEVGKFEAELNAQAGAETGTANSPACGESDNDNLKSGLATLQAVIHYAE